MGSLAISGDMTSGAQRCSSDATSELRQTITALIWSVSGKLLAALPYEARSLMRI
jgi:hypothetical protein